MKAYTSAHVVFGAETHTIGEHTAAASQWAKRHGWKSLWEDALPGAQQSYSVGGVAIFVRSYLGLGPPPAGDVSVVKGRVIAALINTPGTHGFVGYARYLHVSEGLTKRNLAILSAVGEHIAAHGRPFIFGADFNFSPTVLATASFASKVSAQIVHPDTRLGTCFQGAMPSTLDYYVVSNDLAHGVKSAGVDFNALTSPHRPSVLTFHPSLTSLKALLFQRPPPLPVVPPVGPVPPPQDWSRATDLALQALLGAKNQTIEHADQAIFVAYGAWADTAERELADIMQVQLCGMGTISHVPISCNVLSSFTSDSIHC